MRKKILKSKCIHVPLGNRAVELYSNIHVSSAEDIANGNGIKCTGIWDTGSEGCLISKSIAEKLNLVLISYKLVIGVNEENLSPEYLVNIFLPDGPSFIAVSTLVGENLDDDEFIVGMDLINKGDLAVTNVNNKTTMSFRSPSVARINFQTEKKKALDEEESLKKRRNKATRNTQKQRKRRRNKNH